MVVRLPSLERAHDDATEPWPVSEPIHVKFLENQGPRAAANGGPDTQWIAVQAERSTSTTATRGSRANGRASAVMLSTEKLTKTTADFLIPRVPHCRGVSLSSRPTVTVLLGSPDGFRLISTH